MSFDEPIPTSCFLSSIFRAYVNPDFAAFVIERNGIALGSLYALDTVLPDLGRPTVFELRDAMEQHVIAETFLMGTYSYP